MARVKFVISVNTVGLKSVETDTMSCVITVSQCQGLAVKIHTSVTYENGTHRI